MLPEVVSEGMTLILGGARSGKSAYAVHLACLTGRSVLVVATAVAGDEEMRARIAAHRATRPSDWRIVEAPTGLGPAIEANAPCSGPIILDCVTLWVSNIMLAMPVDSSAEVVRRQVEIEIEALLATQAKLGGQWLVVSNEVGLGLVPPSPLGRMYRDMLGWANQRLAQAARRVVFMVAGLPLVVK